MRWSKPVHRLILRQHPAPARRNNHNHSRRRTSHCRSWRIRAAHRFSPNPLTPGERLGGAARTAAQGATGGLSDYLEAVSRTAFGVAPKSTQALREADEAFRNGKAGKVPNQGAATLDDHLEDIHAASQRFGNAYPAQATASWMTGAVGPLAGVGRTALLARILSGEPLIGTLAAPRRAPSGCCRDESRTRSCVHPGKSRARGHVSGCANRGRGNTCGGKNRIYSLTCIVRNCVCPRRKGSSEKRACIRSNRIAVRPT